MGSLEILSSVLLQCKQVFLPLYYPKQTHSCLTLAQYGFIFAPIQMKTLRSPLSHSENLLWQYEDDPQYAVIL